MRAVYAGLPSRRASGPSPHLQALPTKEPYLWVRAPKGREAASRGHHPRGNPEPLIPAATFRRSAANPLRRTPTLLEAAFPFLLQSGCSGHRGKSRSRKPSAIPMTYDHDLTFAIYKLFISCLVGNTKVYPGFPLPFPPESRFLSCISPFSYIPFSSEGAGLSKICTRLPRTPPPSPFLSPFPIKTDRCNYQLATAELGTQ